MNICSYAGDFAVRKTAGPLFSLQCHLLCYSWKWKVFVLELRGCDHETAMNGLLTALLFEQSLTGMN